MNNKFPPNMDPNLFSITAVAAGIVLVDDFNINETNSIGNWLILVGQYLLTFAAQQQLIETRLDNYNLNINSKDAKSGKNPYAGGKSNQNTRPEVEYLLEAVRRIEKELDDIKKDL